MTPKSTLNTRKYWSTKGKEMKMEIFNNIRQAGSQARKPARMFGLLGLMLALAGMFAAVPSAPASAQDINGKLNVYAYNAMQAGLGGIGGATVQVANSTGAIIVNGLTDTKGFFTGYVPEGAYILKVTAPNFQEFSAQFKIQAGSATTIQAGLTPTATSTPVGKLSVHVQDMASGRALAGATVLVLNGNGERVAKALTNAQGNFEVKLQEGTYKVAITADNYKQHSESATLTANQVTTVKVGLEATNSAPTPTATPVNSGSTFPPLYQTPVVP
jgi:5-hydroxyisourate hydrolase-like protein (transthyretin family)